MSHAASYQVSATSRSKRTGDAVRFDAPRDAAYALVRVGTPPQVIHFLQEEGLLEDDELFEHLAASEWNAPVAYLEWIWTDERKRGQGHAEALLEHVLGWLGSEGVAAVYAYSAPGEDEDPYRLLQWYLRHGFDALATEVSDATPIVKTYETRR